MRVAYVWGDDLGVDMKNKRNGFTLIELLVVIGLIGILMALLLPAVIKSKDKGIEQRAQVNGRAIVAAIDAYKQRYHKWPADDKDLDAGRDVTYGVDKNDNKVVFDKLSKPPDGSKAKDDPFIDLSDFVKDKSGNVIRKPGDRQYHITFDIDGDFSPSGGVSVD
jgi:prepilin-type N-terminal cleavage/methylation domain-containing protein